MLKMENGFMIEEIKKQEPIEIVTLDEPENCHVAIPEPKELRGKTVYALPNVTGAICIPKPYGMRLKVIEDGVVRDENYLYPSDIVRSSDYSDYLDHLTSMIKDAIEIGDYDPNTYRKIIKQHLEGGDYYEEIRKKTALDWPVICTYTGECPTAYWIPAATYEEDTEDGGVKIHVNVLNPDQYKALDYLFMEMTDGHLVINTKTQTMEIPLGDNFNENIAIFSEAARLCADKSNVDSVSLCSRINILVKTFDFNAYMKELERKSEVHGDRFTTEIDPVSEVAELVEAHEAVAEETAELDVVTEKNEDATQSYLVEEKSADFGTEKVEPAPVEDINIKAERYATSMRGHDLRIVPNETCSIRGYADRELEFYNYTGHTVHFVDNAVLDPKTRRMVLPPDGPHVIKKVDPLGRMTVTETVLDLGKVSGIPITDTVPTRITAPPEVDSGIIIVTPVYYRNAIRAGLDTSRMYILANKIEWKGENGPEWYYTGLAKRL